VTTSTGSPDIADVQSLDPCLAAAKLGTLILSRCTKLHGHEGEHAGPLDRVTWEAPEVEA
jgi:hypothetical protein